MAQKRRNMEINVVVASIVMRKIEKNVIVAGIVKNNKYSEKY